MGEAEWTNFKAKDEAQKSVESEFRIEDSGEEAEWSPRRGLGYEIGYFSYL